MSFGSSHLSKKILPRTLNFICQKLVVISLSSGDDHNPSKTAVRASSASILARILVMNSNYLAQLTSDPVLLLILQKAGLSVTENILLCLVDIWLEVGGACTMHNMLYLNLACFHLVKNSP